MVRQKIGEIAIKNLIYLIQTRNSLRHVWPPVALLRTSPYGQISDFEENVRNWTKPGTIANKRKRFWQKPFYIIMIMYDDTTD